MTVVCPELKCFVAVYAYVSCHVSCGLCFMSRMNLWTTWRVAVITGCTVSPL